MTGFALCKVTEKKRKRRRVSNLKNEPLSVCAGVIYRRCVLWHLHVKLGNTTLQFLVQLGNLDEESQDLKLQVRHLRCFPKISEKNYVENDL